MKLKNLIFNERILLYLNEITLKVNGIEQQFILVDNIYRRDYLSCPNKIYVNNSEINNYPCYAINVYSPGSIIKLVWNNQLRSTCGLFAGCDSITEINLSNFDTSLVTDMSEMFLNCYSLTSIDLSNVNTNNVEYMECLFMSCRSLISLNLKNFNTSKVKSISYMFYGCNSLVSIDLSNFDTSIITDFGNLFCNCKNLEYINLKNFNDKSLKSKTDTFKGIAQNAVICIDSIKAQSLYNLVKNINTQCIVISCKENWRKVQKKNNTNQCVDNCPSNKYE